MKEELIKQAQKRLDTMEEAIKYQISGLCEFLSIIDTANYFLCLATSEKSKVKELKIEQE